jgi:hypothetical protein
VIADIDETFTPDGCTYSTRLVKFLNRTIKARAQEARRISDLDVALGAVLAEDRALDPQNLDCRVKT